MEDLSRFGRSIESRRLPYALCRYSGDCGNLLDRIFLDSLYQLVEPMTPLLDELLVMQILVDSQMRECKVLPLDRFERSVIFSVVRE